MAAGLQHGAYALVCGRIDFGDSAILFAMPDEHLLVLRIPTQIVRVRAKIDCVLERISSAVKDHDLAVSACLNNFIEAGYVKDSLRFGGARHGADQPAFEPVLNAELIAARYGE